MTTKIDHAQVTARYRSLIEWLGVEGRVDVVEAAARLGVAQETIRRDLRVLEQQGKVQRVHGGAVPVESAGPVPAVAALAPVPHSDSVLSKMVWDRLPQSGTLLIGAGPLTLALALAIVGSPPKQTGLRIVTNSLDAAIVLSRASKLSVYNVGGTVSPATRAQEGDWALSELGRFSVDVTVLGPPGISVEHGMTEDTPAAAAVAVAAVAAARHVIALADARTLGSSAFVQFATLNQVDEIAVAGRVSSGAVQPFLDRGVSVVRSAPDMVVEGSAPLLERTSS